LGTIFSIINFILLGKFIPMTLRHSRTKAGLFGLISILIRLVILAVPMILAIKSSSFEFIAVVAGIFTVQAVTFIQYVVIKPIQDGKKSI
jgi:ATP synthase protein I